MAPYDLLRKLFATFGMDAMQRESFKKRIEREKAIAARGAGRRGGGERPARRQQRSPSR